MGCRPTCGIVASSDGEVVDTDSLPSHVVQGDVHSTQHVVHRRQLNHVPAFWLGNGLHVNGYMNQSDIRSNSRAIHCDRRIWLCI